MKRLYIWIVAGLVILMMGVSSIYFLTRPVNGLSSMSINEEVFELKKGQYEYDIPVLGYTNLEDISFELFNEEDKYLVEDTYEVLYIGDTLNVVVTNIKNEEFLYKFTFIDDVNKEYLQRRIAGCLFEEDVCEMEGEDNNLTFKLKGGKLLAQVNGVGNLELDPLNYTIPISLPVEDGALFIYQNLLNDQDNTLYILDSEGNVLLKTKTIDDNGANILENVEVIDNKIIINTSKVINGFDFNSDPIIPVCEVVPNEIVLYQYELSYLDNSISEPKLLKTTTIQSYLEDLEKEINQDPCDNTEYE